MFNLFVFNVLMFDGVSMFLFFDVKICFIVFKVIVFSYCYSEINVWVFKNLMFLVYSGEIVVIIGDSGCGKSIMFKCLMGLYFVLEGNIEYLSFINLVIVLVF